jgi:hypothetical protein
MGLPEPDETDETDEPDDQTPRHVDESTKS